MRGSLARRLPAVVLQPQASAPEEDDRRDKFLVQVAWLDDPAVDDVSEWVRGHRSLRAQPSVVVCAIGSALSLPDPRRHWQWKRLADSGGQSKRDWKEIRMKSTISITGGPSAAVPGESKQMPVAVPVADDVASAGEVAELKARNQQLQRDLDAALASDDSSAKAEFLREKSALQKENQQLRQQLEAAGQEGGGDGGTVQSVLIALVVLLLGMVAKLLMDATPAVLEEQNAD